MSNEPNDLNKLRSQLQGGRAVVAKSLAQRIAGDELSDELAEHLGEAHESPARKTSELNLHDQTRLGLAQGIADVIARQPLLLLFAMACVGFWIYEGAKALWGLF